MKNKDLEPRPLVLARLSLKVEEEIKSFPDQKKKLKNSSAPNKYYKKC